MKEKIYALELINLTKNYGKITAVKNLNLKVEKGIIHGFLGPNGAGKTTTIRCILNLLKPNSGQIMIFGEQLDKNRHVLFKKIGYLPGDVYLYSYYTVKEHLDYFMALYKIKEAPLRKELANRFQLDETKPVKILSRGNRQKVGIIQAFMHDPELLILDEPTIGLDPLLQEEFFTLLEEFRRRGKTIFFSSHILSEVDRICDMVSIIRNGLLLVTDNVENFSSKIGRKIILKFKDNIRSNSLNIPDLTYINQEGHHFYYHTKKEIREILPQIIKSQEIADFSIPEPSIEDCFLDYYKGEIQ